jgi:pimeloyl-ACP methyl ester carboxylesterase
MVKNPQNPAEYIQPLKINGLKGRVLELPDSNKTGQQILFIYGQHSSLERWWGLIQEFNKFGAVTVPDVPGFGDMTSMYKTGKDASVDNLADYLADFIDQRYKNKNKKIAIFGMSLGFVIVTRMLQRHPELSKRVKILISIVGPAHREDFIFSAGRRRFYACVTWILSRRLPAYLFKSTFLQPAYLRRAYKHSRFAKEKFANTSGDEFKRTMDMELHLWKINDIRTQMKTNFEMMTMDNTKAKIDLPVWHVASKKDRYFDHGRIEKHFRQIFNDFHMFYTKDPNHAPTIIAGSKEAAPFIPTGIRRELRRLKES